MLKTIIEKLLLIIFGILLVLVILEIGLRIGGFLLLSAQERRNLISLKNGDTFRIMCIGESTTAMGGEDAYPYLLEKILNQSGARIRFSVINKGVCGTSTTGLLGELEENLKKYKPNMVIAMMGINDYDWCNIMIPYKEQYNFTPSNFVSSIKIYKLWRLIRMRLLAKTGILRYRKEVVVDDGGRPNPRGLEQNVDNAVKREPMSNEQKEYWQQIGVYATLGKHAEAQKLLEILLKMRPRDKHVLSQLAWCYFLQNRIDNGIEALNKVIEIDPKNDDAYFGLGFFYDTRHEFNLANNMYYKAIEINPRNDHAYVRLGMNYMREEKYAEAKRIYSKGIKENSRNDRAYGGLAFVYQKLGDRAEAAKYFKLANQLRLEYYQPITRDNFNRLKDILVRDKVKLVCVQYPVRSVQPLKKMFKSSEDVIFVDNEWVFKKALNNGNYDDYFSDRFAGDFGHCTPLGNQLLAENIANNILEILKR